MIAVRYENGAWWVWLEGEEKLGPFNTNRKAKKALREWVKRKKVTQESDDG